MYVDKMHSEAIRAADKSCLPMTVYKVDGQWAHTNALYLRDHVWKAKKLGLDLIVTWLPQRFFDK